MAQEFFSTLLVDTASQLKVSFCSAIPFMNIARQATAEKYGRIGFDASWKVGGGGQDKI